LTGPVDSVPLAALVPDQAPEAVQEVAFLLDHVSFEESPTLSELGLAWRVTSGAEALTVTVAVWVAKPPGPLQASSYSVLLVSGPVDHVPLVVTSPCHPPLAVHWSALLALQVNVELPWLPIVVGEATRDTTGAGLVTMTCIDCTVEPPEPVQVSVKLVFAISAAVDNVPVVGWLPLQPPEAIQLWALFTFHVNVAERPAATVVGLNCKLMAGFAELAAPLSLPAKEFWSSPHAARAAMAAKPQIHRAKRMETVAPRSPRSQ